MLGAGRRTHDRAHLERGDGLVIGSPTVLGPVTQPVAAEMDACRRCKSFGPGERYSFEYGTPPRLDSRTLEPRRDVLGRESVFLCARCRRWLAWRANAWHLAPVALLVVGSLYAYWRFGRLPELSGFAGQVMTHAAGAIVVAIRWWRRPTLEMEELCYRLVRRELAARHGVRARWLMRLPAAEAAAASRVR
jgi:hypothetical protein